MADGSRGAGTCKARPSAGLATASLGAIRVLSFFAGCGGLDLGFQGGFAHLGRKFKRNRIKILRAYDVDVRSVKTYRLNVGPHAVVCDLSSANPAEMPSAELLLAGFPCQEFSACGPRKGLDSERGSLYLAMIRYAIVHRPKVILGENVSGILRLNRGADLKKIQKDFKAVGYRCLTWEMHADDFGVAQARHRVFLVFVRDDLPGDPTPPPKRRNATNTVRSAIGDLLDADESDLPNQGQYFRAARAGRGHGQGDEISPADAPGYTVRANSRSRVQFHYSLPRRLTVRECARLQSFPDDFLFPHDATSNMFQIGNAVPPVLAHCVAKQILSYLRHPSVRSAE